MKKILALLLVLCLCLSTFTMISFASTGWEARSADVDLRVGLVGDTHTSKADEGTNSTFYWFKKNIKAILEIGANKLDGFALTGDIVYQNNPVSASNYDAVMSVFKGTHSEFKDTGIANLPMSFAMGNHEYPVLEKDTTILQNCRDIFEEVTGLGVRNTVVMNGFTFIAANADDYYGNVSADTENWIKQEIDKALASDSTNDTNGAFADGVIPNSTKPVFVSLHHPISNTIFNVNNKNYTAEFAAFLKNRPQVIVLTGHHHISAQLPATIWQDGFSIFQISHSAGGNLTHHESEDIPYDVNDVHQGAMIEVKDNVVNILKLDIGTGKYIGTPWVIDIPAIVADRLDSNPSNDNDHYLYSEDKRKNANAPSFPEGTEASVTVDGCSVSINWPHAAVPGEETPNQQDNFVRAYKVEICDADDALVTSKQYDADYYYETSRMTAYSADFGLAYGTDYVLKIYPVGGTGSLGEPIVKAFTTEEDIVPPGATRYEAEDFAEAAGVKEIKTIAMASGGKLVGTIWGGSDTLNVEGTISVDTEGYYDISWAAGQQLTSDVSKVTLYVDGTSVGSNGSDYTKNISNLETYAYSSAPMRIYEKKNVFLTAGEHPVKFEIAPSSKASGGVRKYYIDYLQVQFPQGKTVTGTKGITVEFEDYMNRKENPGASGGAIASSNWKTGNCDLLIPIKVQDAGYYDFEFVIGYTRHTDSYPQINITFGKIGLGNNLASAPHDETLDTSVYTNYYDGMPLRRYKYSNKWVEAGTHTIGLDFLPADSVAKKFNLDYFKITPTPDRRVNVSAAESTTIEFDDYRTEITQHTVIKEASGASGGKFISTGWTSQGQFTFPINIEKSGYYDVEYVLGALQNGTDHSKWEMYIDDTVIGKYSDSDTIGKTVPDGYTDVYPANSIRKFRENAIRIEAGSHLVKLVLQKTESTKDHYTYVADYIRFTPRSVPKVNLSGSASIEFDWFTPCNTHIDSDDFASGGKLISGSWSSYDPTRTITFEVEQDGYYEIEWIVGMNNSNYDYSMQVLYLDGDDGLGWNNNGNGTVVTGYAKDYAGMPMRKLSAKRYLTKGAHTLTNWTRIVSDNGVWKFCWDNAKITPLDYVSKDGNKVSVIGIYDKVLTGKAIMAFYNGDELVSLKIADASNAKYVKFTATETKTFDNVKIFMWNNLNDVVPLAKPKTFSVQ